jgi:AraC family transcriptional activator of pobA
MYGQQAFDFDEGILNFTAPGRVFTLPMAAGAELTQSGYIALIHPDFLCNTPLAGKIKHYDFFDYTLTEALFLSAKEEAIISELIANIHAEYCARIDGLSRSIIISQLLEIARVS